VSTLIGSDVVAKSSIHIGGSNRASEKHYFLRDQCLNNTDIQPASPQSIVCYYCILHPQNSDVLPLRCFFMGSSRSGNSRCEECGRDSGVK
jgi:hypothetical protein